MVSAPFKSKSRSWDMPVFWAFVALALAAPLAVYPVFLMKVLCFALFACAFNLLVGYVGLLSFGHAMFFGFAAYVAGHLAKVGTVQLPIGIPFLWRTWLTIPLPPLTPELAILAGTLVAALLGLIVGLIAIRRQGIYFAMVTLALAQMVYLPVRAGAVHGRRGRHPGDPARAHAGRSRRAQRLRLLLRRAGDLLRRLPRHLPHHPFAVRPGAQGDPRERGACDLAGLCGGPLQADRLRAVGGARRSRRRHQGHGVPARLAHRRARGRCRARWCS